MKWVKTYESFRKTEMINEKIWYNQYTCKSVIEMQMKGALAKFPDKQNVDNILEWVKTTIMNPKSDLFLVRPIVEELKNTSGKGGSVLPKRYWGNGSENETMTFQDYSYYVFMGMMLQKQLGLLADTDDMYSEHKSKKNIQEWCGFYFIELMCQQKFENQLPYSIIKYCVKKIRREVAREIGFMQSPQPSKHEGIVITGITIPEKATGLDTYIYSKDDDKEQESKNENKTVLYGCFLDKKPTNHIPELKQLLVKIQPEPALTKESTPAERKAVCDKIGLKKKDTFISYIKSNIYPKFEKASEGITKEEIENYLKEQKIDIESGKKTYDVGDIVIFLRKDKTKEDWNNLKDYLKVKFDDSETKRVVGEGRISNVTEDGIYTIELKNEKSTKKTSDQILKKLSEAEKDEEENDDEKKEGQTESQNKPEASEEKPEEDTENKPE